MRIVSLTTCLVMFTTIAQASGYYAGIVRGQSEIETGVSAGKGSTIDNKSSAGYVFLGREFDNNAAVEGFYANLGKAKLSFKNGSTARYNGKDYEFTADGTATASVESFGIAGKYHFDIHDGVRLSAKLGLHSWKSKLDIGSTAGGEKLDNDGVDAMAGLGVEYKATDKIAIMAGLDNFAVDDEDATITYVGVKFSFN